MSINMNFTNGYVTVTENTYEGLYELISSVDADFSGESGEYLLDNEETLLEAKLKYAISKYSSTQQVLECVLSSVQRYSEGYYFDFQYDIVKLNDNEFYICIAATH